MFYVNKESRQYQETYEEGLIEVDDDITNATFYGITPEGNVVDAWGYNGVTYTLNLRR
jgi:hypothetical protein